jgi:hypothetical protein
MDLKVAFDLAKTGKDKAGIPEDKVLVAAVVLLILLCSGFDVMLANICASWCLERRNMEIAFDLAKTGRARYWQPLLCLVNSS